MRANTFLTPLAREVLAHLPDPLMLLDQGGRVLFANSAMYRVIGIGPENKHVSLLLRTPVGAGGDRAHHRDRRRSVVDRIHRAGAGAAALPGLCRAHGGPSRR